MTLILEIRVTPSSSKRRFTLDKAHNLKCYLRSAPEKGKANAELIELIAELLDLPKSAIEIQSGHADRKKRIALTTKLSKNEVLRLLGIELQQNIS